MEKHALEKGRNSRDATLKAVQVGNFGLCLRNTKHVIETRAKVWDNQKYCGNTNRSRVIPQLFRVLPKFLECFKSFVLIYEQKYPESRTEVEIFPEM